MSELNLQELKKLVNNSLKIVGKKQVLKAIIFSLNSVRCVIIARDAEGEVVEPILDLCKQKKVQVYFAANKQELGFVAGIDVMASVVALLN